MYVVIEFMVDPDGNPGTLSYAFTSIDDAKAKFYSIMSVAATSNTQIHSAAIMTDEMFLLKSDFCRHDG